ncbi:U-box domain-containing protein 34 [Cucumis sativus]|nr:U-box domain-containing protein 34 [Cucumis sativus]KAE8651489.1 hypothetical protein Csa_019343 [Cucumis sativus]
MVVFSKAMTSVAIAVNGVRGGKGGGGSRRAVRWAVENLLPTADRFILVHVMPKITSIPTPMGDLVAVSELDADVVALYVHDVKQKYEQVFVPFKKLCKREKFLILVETLILEDDNPATALLRYASESGIKSLVLGSCFRTCIARKLKGDSVPSAIMRTASSSFDIYVKYKRRVITRKASTAPSTETDSRQWMLGDTDYYKGSSADSEKSLGTDMSSSYLSIVHQRDDSIGVDSTEQLRTLTEEEDMQSEVESLQLELETTVSLYKQACEELVRTQKKVQSLTQEYLEESRKVTDAVEREQALRKVAAKEKAKHLEAIKELEEAKDLLAKEAYERQLAELDALKESVEKQKIIDTLLTNDRRYRRYTTAEIEAATNFFNEVNVIGEGGYGKVYKSSLDHTPVAIKVFQHDIFEKKDEFLKEVEILSQIRHPHVVLLLGACPERGCLIYEYMENGSLDDHILLRNGKAPLPWSTRFRIVFQVASGLAFLHNSKPEPIIHRDLKPGNILLDRNFVSKISDVGMAKIIGDIVPDNVTAYQNTVLAGTLHYMDPEYQRTGTLRPKSDTYALGVTILQLLTGRQPHGLLLAIENSIASASLADILDKSISNWPLAKAEELARLALKCLKLRCRDRPDLESEVLPILKRLVDFADTFQNEDNGFGNPPSHYFCPILQEVMEDPYIAADGFSYEYVAIKAWLEKHDVSPATKLKLRHSFFIPNYTLRSAIREWRSRVTFSSS